MVSLENTGTKLINKEDTITLSAKVYDGNNDVTENINAVSFNWYRVSGSGDNEWNTLHKARRSITVSTDDVNINANFHCEITLPIGIRKTQSISVTDNNDIANLGNSYLDVTGSSLIQTLDNYNYFPDWQLQKVVVTPAVLDGILNIELDKCEISFKKIIDKVEVDLTDGEEVNRGILTISKNIMTKDFPAITYVCYVSYKNTKIKLFKTFTLNIIGQDGLNGQDGIGIVNRTIYYAIATSSTVAPTSGWTTITPIRTIGQFLWSKEITKLSDGTAIESAPAMITGDSGDDAAIMSANEPTDKSKLWFDTTNNLLKYWNGTSWEVTNDFAGEINDSKQLITTEYTTAINQLKESLTTLVERLQTSTTDNTTLIERLSSQIIQNVDSISFVTNRVDSINDSLSGLATKEEISQWARFQGGILELGGNNSPFAVKLSNTELGFYQNGSRIAYLSNQQLNIDFAIVMTKLTIGNFTWSHDTTDGLTLS